MALPDAESFRVHAHEIRHNAYCIKRFFLHPKTFKRNFELFSIPFYKKLYPIGISVHMGSMMYSREKWTVFFGYSDEIEQV